MKLTTPLRAFFIAMTACGLIATEVSAKETATADDGRSVILKNNGDWEFANQDRLATKEDGSRVLLKADGRWEVIEGPKVESGKALASGDYQAKISHIIVESYRKKGPKSDKLKTQMVFQLEISAKESAKALPLSLSTQDMSIRDNKGRDYETVSINPEQTTLQPGLTLKFEVRADGSPHWWGSKIMQLEIPAGTLGNDVPLTLEKSMDYAKKLDRDTPFPN